jgi:hypothetical protein
MNRAATRRSRKLARQVFRWSVVGLAFLMVILVYFVVSYRTLRSPQPDPRQDLWQVERPRDAKLAERQHYVAKILAPRPREQTRIPELR